jgi:hypothetical protein
MPSATNAPVQAPMFEAGTVETTVMAGIVLDANRVTADQLIARHRGGDFGLMKDAGDQEQSNTKAIARGSGLVSSAFDFGLYTLAVMTNLRTSQTLICENMREFGRVADFFEAALPPRE